MLHGRHTVDPVRIAVQVAGVIHVDRALVTAGHEQSTDAVPTHVAECHRMDRFLIPGPDKNKQVDRDRLKRGTFVISVG
jgi:hypothetical protein